MWSQISISPEIVDKNKAPLRSNFIFDSYQISPIRGIILPDDSQLVKISAPAPSEIHNNKHKKIQTKPLPHKI